MTEPSKCWSYTDDPDAPCSYCVQWRCATCESTDSCDHEHELFYTVEPYSPDGSVIRFIRRDTCPGCEDTLADYYAQKG